MDKIIRINLGNIPTEQAEDLLLAFLGTLKAAGMQSTGVVVWEEVEDEAEAAE